MALAQDEKPKQADVQPTNIKGPIAKTLLLKPYITIGYHVPELFTHKNTAISDFFADLSRFTNFKIGAGIRITSYLGFELAYDSIGRMYTMNDAATHTMANVKLMSHGIYLNAVFFSPSIDVKFGTLEFAVNIGTMIMVSMQHDILHAPVNNPSWIESVSSSLGPQFMAGFSIIYGFPKLFTIRGFTEVITLSDMPFDTPVILNSGIAINIYLI